MIVGKLKKAFYSTLTLTVTLVIVDVVLHGAAQLSPQIDRVTSFLSAKIPDKQLGYRPNPGHPEHDENGFRNPVVPETAHIVALGDSHTYGTGVKPEDAWPKVLQGLSGSSVYSMSMGGYGPVHSLMLWEEAASLQPNVVIEGIYSGNDLYDSFSMVYGRGQMQQLLPEDETLIQAMRQRGQIKLSRRLAIKAWFVNNSRIVGLLRRVQFELSHYRKTRLSPPTPEQEWDKAKARAAKNANYYQIFSSSNSRTVFTSERRLAALDFNNPIVGEGQRIVHGAIDEMHNLAKRDGIRFVVLLIPTKELVFSEQAKQLDAPSYHRLIRNEQQFWQVTKSFLEAHSIEFIDPLQALRAELEAGNQPYQVSYDGHPNEIGYHAIAKTVNDYLQIEKRP